MSHEGIRILTEEQARREAAQEEKSLPPAAVTPAKVRVMKSEGTGVTIDWKDGHRSSWNFAWLRQACPCAVCNEERKLDGRLPGVPRPAPGGPLVMYQPPPRPQKVEPVGKYALRFQWNDGHEAGIYSWNYFRSVCQCAVCEHARRMTHATP